MGLGDITGIFSRFFVVGFFLPSFYTVVLLYLAFAHDIDESRVLLLGGGALLLALLLLGIRDIVWFKFSGYWKERKHMIGCKERPRPEPKREDMGFWERWFVWNEFRRRTNDYRTYVMEAFGLDTWVAWPLIQGMFTDREREIHVDALANVHFFQNACLGSLAITAGLLVSLFVDPIAGAFGSFVLAIAFIGFAYLCYRGAVAAVALWGENKIASAVAHRNELYDQLGFRFPTSTMDERAIGKAATDMLYDGQYGPTPDVRARP